MTKITTIQGEGPSKPVRVECSDGTVYDSDHVICTVSLGVLKERHTRWFDPPLNAKHVNAIEGLSIGATGKIFLEFKRSFWPDDWSGFGLVWNTNELTEIRENPNQRWLEGVFRFLTVDYQPNVLCARIAGDNHTKQMEMMSDNIVIAGILRILKMFLPKWAISQPIQVKRANWLSNPNFRGSYSFNSLKSDAFNASRRELSQPIKNSVGDPAILFAGEATHEHFYSTVHGAVESGWREAIL